MLRSLPHFELDFAVGFLPRNIGQFCLLVLQKSKKIMVGRQVFPLLESLQRPVECLLLRIRFIGIRESTKRDVWLMGSFLKAKKACD